MLVTERNFGDVMDRLERYDRLDMDTETTGFHTWHGARQIGVSVKIPESKQRGYYFPFRHKPGGNLGPQRLKLFMRLLSEKQMTCWHGKFDAHMTMADGAKFALDQVEDAMLLLHLLDENQYKTGGSYELKVSAAKFIDPQAQAAELKLTNLLADRGLDKGDMQELTAQEVEEYAVDDAYYTEALRSLMIDGAKEWGIDSLWKEVNEYSMVTRRMEERGFMIDLALCRKYSKEAVGKAAEIKARIDAMAGYDINLRSNPQLQRWLELPSTAEDYIEEVYWRLTDEQKAAITELQTFRKWDRVTGSYYSPFLENVDRDGAYHPNVKLHGTISGRPSSSGTPNPFAIPRWTDIYKVKDVIVARPGYTLISMDYSQMELRFGAHYSGDKHLIKCFKEGKSPHKLMMADLISRDVDIDYDDTKRVNFAIMYGTGAQTLSKELKKPEKFARMILKIAHGMHPNYKPMLEQAEATGREFGFIRLWTGRVRHFDTLPDPQPWFRKACSNLIQGGVGEVMRIAITRLAQWLPDWDAHMLLQVYDQVLFEVPTSVVKGIIPHIRADMVEDFPFTIPFAVDIKVGKRWGQLKEYAA